MAAVNFWRRLTQEKGAELIEFALVFPLLLLVVVGIMDFGLLLRQYEVLTNAAREGARVAVLPGYAPADVQARVNQYLVASGMAAAPTPPVVSPPQAVDVGGACITLTGVTVSYPYNFLFLGGIGGYFGGSYTSTTLSATASMRYEGGAMACP
jgi:Flp pilus assembly protein TadG